MGSYLSNKPNNFVDDPEKLYRIRRCEAQTKRLESADPKAEAERSPESPKESPPQSPWENRLPPMGEQPQSEHKIGAMHPGHRRPTNLEPHGDRKAVRDQDLNNSHGATFTLRR
jgi:hypothetical protein